MLTTLQTRLKHAGRWLPVALLSLFSFVAQAQAPANDNPTGAITLPLGATCTPVNATNTGATTTVAAGLGYTNPGCGVAVNPKDVWFTFTTNASGQGSSAVTVTVSGTVAGQVRVFSSTGGAAGAFTEVGCSAGLTNNTQAGPLDLRGLMPNTTYYVFVSGYGSGDTMGAFTICASQLTLANNDAGVTALYTLGKVSSAFGSPVSVQTVITNQGLNTLTNLPVTLTVGGATTYTNTQTIASLASNATTTLTFSYPVTATTGTNTVTVTVPNDDQASNNSQSVTQAVSANDMSYISGTTFTNGAGLAAAGSLLLARYTANGPAAVTSITPTFYGPASSATATYQAVIYSATGTGLPGTLLYTSPARPRPTLATGVTGSDPVTVPSIPVGTTYFVGVKAVAADNLSVAYQTEAPLRSGTFFYSADNGATFVDVNTSTLNSRLALDVTLGTPAACGVVTGATTSTTTTTATISFTAPSGATNYTVTYTPAGGTPTTVTPAPTGSPVTLTGLTPSTTYTVNITTNCPGGQTSAVSTVTFTTRTPAPANDDCATASVLALTAACTPVNSTNTNSTASPASVPAATCGGTTGPDVWFAITVPANGAVTVTTSASSVTTNQLDDTVLQLYSGTCGSLTAIGCNDDIGGGSSYSTVALNGLTAGSTIYARVFGYASATGDFAICATSPSCLPVSNVAISNLTTTGATISFTAPTGATSYTVTYTAAGGTPTTVTPAPTASPITLTGLTAATTYTVTIATNCGATTATTVGTTFRTLGTAYCVTSLGGACGANNITAIAITGTTFNATGLTCTPGGTPAQAYTSYPATGANTASLNVATTYPITVTTAVGSSVTVWVDYNHNLNFEPSEFVLLTANATTTTVTGALVVPANAVLGQTSLRIRTRLNGNSNGPGDACSTFGSGETKDFTVTLRNATGTRNDALAATVGLFPNPAHQGFQLTVPAGSLHNATATLRNTLGQVVQARQLSLPVTGGNAEFNVSTLAAGVYTLTLKSGEDLIVKRVVVE